MIKWILLFSLCFLLESCADYDTSIKMCYINEDGSSTCVSTEFHPIQKIKDEK